MAIQLDTGTFQGSVLSPFLFDLFINTLLQLLDSSGTSHKVENPPDWNHQAFAGDFSLYMENTADADTLLKLVQKFQDWSGLKISTKNRLPREPCMAARPEEAKQWPMLRLAGKRLALQKAGDWQRHAKGTTPSCLMSRTSRWRGRST